MKKIKSVTLLRDLPGMKAGTKAVDTVDTEPGVVKWKFLDTNTNRVELYHSLFINDYPDWFRVEYQEENNFRVDIELYRDDGSISSCFAGKYLSYELAKKLQEYLKSKLDEYLKSRCSKCGGEIGVYDKNNGMLISTQAFGMLFETYRSCQSCGHVEA